MADFILDIDTKFLANLQKADDAIKRAVNSSSQLSTVFASIVNGSSSLSDQLSAIQTRLASMKHIKLEDVGGFIKMKADARTAMDQVNLLTQNMRIYESELKKLAKVSRGQKAGGIPMLIDTNTDLRKISELKTAIKSIQEVQRDGSYAGKPLTLFQTQFLNEQVALYRRAIKELSKSDEQRLQDVAAGANREIAEIKRKVSTVLSEEQRLISQRKADAQKQSVEVREAISLGRTAKSAQELADALNRISALKNSINPNTRKGQLQLQMLERAADAAQKKLAQASVSGSINFAKSARTVEQLRQALANLQAAKGHIIPGTQQGKRDLKEIERQIARVKSQLEAVDGKSRSFGARLDEIKSGIAGAFGLHFIARFTSQLIKVHAEFEKINISLKVLVGNSAQAEMLWDRITGLALKSPFTIQQLAQSTKQMAAYRIETNKLYSSTKMLADISAGLGVEMSRLILAYGQVKAANFLRGTELRQFSEAGIDMLGQLASYFSEMEGKAISAAEVFDRISKRQVLFEDVDAVLRRVTSAGGAFYEMQEKQAQTLAGQISNLKDSIQMMFHDIGTSSHGTLIAVVKMARTLIENWEVWVPLLASSAASLILIKSTLMAISAMKAVVKLFTATPMLGWSSVAIAGILAVLSYLGIFKDKVEETSEHLEATSAIGRVFEEQQRAIEKAGLALAGYTSHINRLKKEQEGLAKEDSRYIQNSNLIEGLIAARSSAVAELAGKNSKVASSIGEIIDKEQELIEWYTKESKKYARRSILADVFNVTEDDSKVLRDYEKALKQLFAHSGESLAGAGKYKDRFEAAGKDPKAWAEIAKEYITEFTNISEEIRRAEYAAVIASSHGNQKLAQEYYNQIEALKGKLRYLDPTGEEKFFNFLKNFTSADKVLNDLATSARDSWLEMYGIQTVADITEENRKSIIDDFEDLISTMDDIPHHVVYMRHALSEAFNFEWTLPKFEPTGWQNRYNEWIEAGVDAIGITAEAMEAMDRAFARISKEGVQESKIIEGLKEKVKSTKEIIDAYESYTDAQKKSGEMRYTLDDYNEAQTENQIAKYFLSFFGLDGEDKNKKGLRDALSSIKEVYKAYKDLREVMSEPSAKTGAWDKYRGMVKEALDKAGIDIDSFIAKVGDMTSEDSVIAALEELKTKAATASDRVAVERAIGEFKLDVKLNVDKTDFEKAMDDAEKLIDGYQLGVELDKLHIPHDFAQNFFDIGITELPELRLQIMAQFEGFDLGTEEWKKINDTLQKVDELEAKAQQERLKKYVAYTRNVVGERGKILMEEFHQLQEIAETFTVTDKMALDKGIILPSQLDVIHSYGETISTMLKHTDEDILQWSAGLTSQQLAQLRLLQQELEIYQKDAEDAVRRDTAEKLSKQDFGIFKEGEVFERVFSDVENASDKLIELTLSKLREFKDIWSGTDVSELSEVLEKIAQLESELAKDSSKSYVKKATENLGKAMRGKGDYAIEFSKRADGSSVWENKAESDKLRYNDYNEFREALEEELVIREDIVNKASIDLSVAELKYEKLLENAKATDDEKNAAMAELETRKSDLSTAKQRLDVVVQTLSVDKNRREAMEKESERLSKSLELANDLYDAFKGMAAVFAEEDSIGMTFADMGAQMANTVINTIMLQIQLQSATVAATAFGAAMQSAMGIIGWIVMGVQLLTMALTAAFKAHDKNLQNQIDAEVKKVETLKKAYEALEKQLEKAFTASDMGHVTREMAKNLEKQIDHTEKMIALEEDKKKSDQDAINGWKDDIQDMKDTIEELYEETFSTVTDGILDDVIDASRNFVDAWYDAFRETGDGMKGLKDTFKEMLLDMLKQQATMNVMSKWGAKYKKWLKEYVNPEAGDEEFTKEEAAEYAERVKETFPVVNEELEGYLAAMMEIADQFETGGLSGLQKGIQGITEDQAEVLASYWNSCRYLLANVDTTLTDIATRVLGDTNGPNSIIGELKRQTDILRDIYSTLESVVATGGNSTHGGAYIKVFDM